MNSERRQMIRDAWHEHRYTNPFDHMSWRDYKEQYEQEEQMNYEIKYETLTPNPWVISGGMVVDCCEAAVQPRKNVAKEKENPMYNSSTMTPTALEAQQRQYLLDRESSIAIDKSNELSRKFYLTDDAQPATPKELRERLEKGLYVIKGETENKFPPYETVRSSLQWRDPSKPADHAGFDAATDAMAVVQTKLRDDIRIAPVADALTALRAFESSTVN